MSAFDSRSWGLPTDRTSNEVPDSNAAQRPSFGGDTARHWIRSSADQRPNAGGELLRHWIQHQRVVDPEITGHQPGTVQETDGYRLGTASTGSKSTFVHMKRPSHHHSSTVSIRWRTGIHPGGGASIWRRRALHHDGSAAGGKGDDAIGPK
ncbi:hypothetical protein LY76DRAFT_660457 [Colletotrichum caudatum]|nr:hypothetical protein LY76DRAFT_660457 [Colletotrichum caudatum]